jgi:cell wall-associated NlpC family hydrolase
LPFPIARLRALAVPFLAVAALVTMAPGASAASPTPPAPHVRVTTAAARVIVDARSHLGARYRYATQGPRTFDCSGLVLRMYADAGVVSRIGGWGNRSGYEMLAWGRRHHLVSRTQGQPGDVVVWGGGAHVGIYLGHGMAISALVEGVRIHAVGAVTHRFTAFIHTGISRLKVRVKPAPRPTVARHAVTRHAATVRYAQVALLVRGAAGTSARVIVAVPRGTPLTVAASTRDSHRRLWYRVSVHGRTGWVAGWLTGTRP